MEDETAYFETKEFQDILKRYEDSVRSGQPTYVDADDLADIADYYQYQGQPEKANKAVELALQINPEAIGPLLYKAREALTRSDFETARAYADHLRALDELEALYLQGEILICEDKVEEADQLFRQRFTDTPADEQQDYVYDVANLYSEYNLHQKAMEWAVRSQGDNSDDFKELMARTLFGLGKYEDSSRLFNELIDHHPYSKQYWNALASAQYMNEDYGGSITSSEYAIAIDPNDPESLLSKANGLYSLENYEEALNYFERYTEKADGDEYGYLHQGACLINLGRYDEAIVRLSEAEDHAPGDSPYLAEIYQELAFAYSEKHLPETALYYLDKTKELDCDHVDLEVIRGHVLLSNLRMEEAEKVFTKAIADSGNSPAVMLRIIVSLYDNRLLTAAYTLFRQFFSNAASDWSNGYAYMALCCWDMQKYDEFMVYLQEAVDKNPKEARLVLGHLFPEGMKPEEYADYIKPKLNKK